MCSGGCGLRAGTDKGGRCCEFCPTAHTWECLSRNTPEERAAATRKQEECDPGDLPPLLAHSQLGASNPAYLPDCQMIVNVYEEMESEQSSIPAAASLTAGPSVVLQDDAAAHGQPTDQPSESIAEATERAIRGARPAGIDLPTEDRSDEMRWMAYEGRVNSDREAAMAVHDNAFAAHGIKRAHDGGPKPKAQISVNSAMPVTAQWVAQRD